MANAQRSPITAAVVEPLAVEAVVIGIRRRRSLGRLQSLQRSIEEHGLIHPILVRNGTELVAGHRRLEACRRLGWRTIPARAVDGLSDAELRAVEVDENREREALNDFDASKARLAEIRQAEADLKATATAKSEGTPPSNRKGGRGQKAAGSRRDVAEKTGIDPKAQREVEQHVAIAEQYPFLQRRGWVQHSVLEAGATLEKLPPSDRPKVAALLDQEAIPPKTAIGIIGNLASMTVTARREVFALAQSDEEHDRRTALTKAAALPAPVDPGLTLLGDACATLRRSAQLCRQQDFQPTIATLAKEAREVLTAFEKWNSDARR